MVKQHNQVMVSLLVIADACAVAVAWVLSYWIRFRWLPVDAEKGIPSFWSNYFTMMPLVALSHLVIFTFIGLYRPRRDRPILNETRDIVKAFIVAVVAVIVIDYAMPQTNKISRHFIATYAVMGTTCFALFRGTVRALLHALRRRGWNSRTAVIVGTGRSAQRLLHALRYHSWIGMRVIYFVDDHKTPQRQVRGIPVKGPLSRFYEIFEEQPADCVFVALPGVQAVQTQAVLASLENCMADVRLVPEVDPSFAIRPDVGELDGVPILSLRQTPLVGWNALTKRLFDLFVASVCLVIALPVMGVIAVLIKLKSPGPVFYRQRRMGLDGQEFTLIKFRTMVPNAEQETGPVWAARSDARRTRLGAFLRRTSLDELPNLFNVLAGQMSLVGPRPERPEFIEKFKHEIPRYMLRHKMKAGMTGYAQVNGFRGNTSLRKRIQHDVYYIKNWSLGLDIQILARTMAGAWFSKHET